MLNKKNCYVAFILMWFLMLSACGVENTVEKPIPEIDDTIEIITEESENISSLDITEEYAGKWISVRNSDFWIDISSEGSGQYVAEETVDFKCMSSETGLETDLNDGLEFQEYVAHGIKYLTNPNLGDFFFEQDVQYRDESKEIAITPDNWEEYFEIHRDTFGENSYETGRLCYLCEILYVTVKDEYADRVDNFKDFSVTFDFSYHHIVCFADVDDIAHTFEEATLRTDYGRENGSEVFNNESYSRIKKLDYSWIDGFAHARLRDDYYFEYWQKYTRDIWFYDTVKEIELEAVSGSIFLYDE